MIKKITVNTENTRIEIERNVGEAKYTTRIWFIPIWAEPGAEYEPLINTERGDNVFGEDMTPAKAEEIVTKCRENGFDIVVEDEDVCDPDDGQNH